MKEKENLMAKQEILERKFQKNNSRKVKKVLSISLS
jgi:hypothetical protein